MSGSDSSETENGNHQTKSEISSDDNQRIENLREDLEQLKNDLEWYNSAPFERNGEEAFNTLYQKIYSEVPNISDAEFEFKIRELISGLGDGHIDIWSDEEYESTLPVMIDELDDGFYIINATERYRKLIGKRVEDINGVKIEDLIKTFESISNSESDNWKRAGAIDKLHDPHFYEITGLTHRKGFIKINGEEVQTISTLFNAEEWVKEFKIQNLPNFFFWTLETDQTPYKAEWFKNDEVLILRFSSCEAEIPNYGLVSFGQDVKKQVKEKQPKALLLDLRGNGGGSTAALYTAFSEYFFKESGFLGSPNFFIATDNQTFSAGVTTTRFVKERWGATHIGEATGGSPFTTSVSETAQKTLKNTGLNFRVSSEKVSREMINTPTETPDIEIKRTINDILNDRDPIDCYVFDNYK